jgi:hypothetical protein
MHYHGFDFRKLDIALEHSNKLGSSWGKRKTMEWEVGNGKETSDENDWKMATKERCSPEVRPRFPISVHYTLRV